MAGFIAFGLFSLPSGWPDKLRYDVCFFYYNFYWCVYSKIPFEIAVWLFAVGIFASIYHPVGLALIAKFKNISWTLL